MLLKILVFFFNEAQKINLRLLMRRVHNCAGKSLTE